MPQRPNILFIPDPLERFNVYYDPAYADVVKVPTAKLDAAMLCIGDVAEHPAYAG
tara:strand:- start:1641 stop:1805 length:165 start_codon:yes stop_codon:yes gene_type:complete